VSNGYWFRNVFRWGILSLDLKRKKIIIGNVKFIKPETDQIKEIGGLIITYTKHQYSGINNLSIRGTQELPIYIDLIFFEQSKVMKGTMIYNDRTHYISLPIIDDIENLVKIENTTAEMIPVNMKSLLEKHNKVVKEIKEIPQVLVDEKIKVMGDIESEGEVKK